MNCKNVKLKKSISVCLSLILLMSMVISVGVPASATEEPTYYVNLTNNVWSKNADMTGSQEIQRIEEQPTADAFKALVKTCTAPVYNTWFLFNGVGETKEIQEDGTVKAVRGFQVININTTGNIIFTGTRPKATIAVNTNTHDESGAYGVGSGNVNIILNGVTITNKKIPAILTYNKTANNTSDATKVTIKTVKGTKNYITGANIKKTSTMDPQQVSTYKDINEIYGNIDNKYYYPFKSEELKNILFASINANSEDIPQGNPCSYYKYSGAISGDTDIDFAGEGFLKITNEDKEGIEGKGNINFIGGSGDYEIFSEADGINTSTTDTDMLIDANSLYVEVFDDEDAEADAMDSNGTLHIEGGKVVALAAGADGGLTASKGVYIDGGEVLATGSDPTWGRSASKQNFIHLLFENDQVKDSTISINDADGNTVMAYKTPREIGNIFYSSPALKPGSYTVYTGATVEGTKLTVGDNTETGLFNTITSIEGGIRQQHGGMKYKDTTIEISPLFTIPLDGPFLNNTFYNVTNLNIKNADVKLDCTTYDYTGNANMPTATITGLTEKKDFIVTYTNNIDVGKATAIVTGMGNYSGTKMVSFEITKAQLTSHSIELAKSSYTYSGEAYTPAVKIAGLKEDLDFTVAYSNNIDAGTAIAIVTGVGNYNGIMRIPFEINKAQLPSQPIELGKGSYTYSGTANKPTVKIAGLKEDLDFIVTYSNNINVGTATATVTGVGNYSGTKSVAFEINKAKVSAQSIELSKKSYSYNGKAKKPTVTIAGLKKGTDFTVAYSNNINAGKATATVTGIGNYSGTKKVTFKIRRAKLKAKKIKLSKRSYIYNGIAKEPTVNTVGLTSDEDFTVQYKNNINIGNAKVIVRGKGNYRGKITKRFKIKKSQ